MSAINVPATIDEIAMVMGKGTTTIERWAKKENWPYTAASSHSRHKKRYYTLKGLPKAIQTVLFNHRFSLESQHVITTKSTPLSHGVPISTRAELNTPQRNSDQRTDCPGEHLNDLPDGSINESL